MLLILAILLIMGAVIYFIFRENGKDRCEEVSEPIVNDGLPNEYKNLSDAEILKDEGEIETEPDKKIRNPIRDQVRNRNLLQNRKCN